MARILSVSYHETLLQTRQSVLESEGHDVVSAQGFVQGLEQCNQGGFDLFILGHSIPHKDKQRLVEAFHSTGSAPVISLLRNCEAPVDSADFHVHPDPDEIVRVVAKVLASRSGGAS